MQSDKLVFTSQSKLFTNIVTKMTDNCSEGACSASKPQFYLIVHNVAKRNNLGQMLRSACAFGVAEVLIVGNKKNTAFFGAQGTQNYVKMRTFDRLGDAVAYARCQGCETITGVEICDEALPVSSTGAFAGPTAFILGNEGHGMNEAQMAVCDRFVYIPHFGGGTASLNVTVAASIIFHRFAEWAGYVERERLGQKFIVPPRHFKKGAETEDDFALQQARQAKALAREQQALAGADDGSLGALFQ